MRSSGLFAAVFLIVFSVRGMGSSYSEELILQSHQKNLAQEKKWKRLLVYSPFILHGSGSLITKSRDFFLSEAGDHDPQAELDATLKAFVHEDDQKDFSVLPPVNNHAQCKYPARFIWLDSQLHFDFSKMPKIKCERLQNFIDEIDPGRISYVFSSGFMGSPASMFGHTFIQIHRRAEPSGHHASSLLDYTVSFAAYPDTFFPLTYAMKGLLGAFPGRYDIGPYYMKIEEYNNFESRDLWEYELNFNEEQAKFLLYYLWEVGRNDIAYYYFDVNCASLLLTMLEAVDPSLNLSSQYVGWVIPSDTARAVFQAPGLVKEIHFRPSVLTRYLARYRLLDERGKDCLSKLVASGSGKSECVNGFDPVHKARLLDATLEFIGYSEKLSGNREPVKYASLRNSLLDDRATAGVPSEPVENTSQDEAPHLGHSPTRLTLSTIDSSSRGFYEFLEWQPALHDISSPGMGYSDQLEIKFMDMAGSYGIEDKRFRFEKFDLLEIFSAAAWKADLRPTSWRLSLGGSRELFNRPTDAYREYFSLDFGITLRIFNTDQILCLLFGGDLGHSSLEGQAFYAAPELRGIYAWPMARTVKLSVDSSIKRRFGSVSLWDFETNLESSFLFNQSWDARVRAGLWNGEWTAGLGVSKYF